MSDRALEAANRAAHKVARAAFKLREAKREAFARGECCYEDSAAWIAGQQLHHALVEYEEAERRAQSEATR